jgi:single-strand DNA-binding protein
MQSLNKVSLIGYLGKDPEIRSFQNGGRVAAFSLATSDAWKDQSGERHEKTEWHRVSVLTDRLIGVIEKHVKKGSRVYIEGRIETRKWNDKDGQERYSTEIVLRNFESKLLMLDSKPSPPASDKDAPPGAPADAPLDDVQRDVDGIPF